MEKVIVENRCAVNHLWSLRLTTNIKSAPYCTIITKNESSTKCANYMFTINGKFFYIVFHDCN